MVRILRLSNILLEIDLNNFRLTGWVAKPGLSTPELEEDMVECSIG